MVTDVMNHFWDVTDVMTHFWGLTDVMDHPQGGFGARYNVSDVPEVGHDVRNNFLVVLVLYKWQTTLADTETPFKF